MPSCLQTSTFPPHPNRPKNHKHTHTEVFRSYNKHCIDYLTSRLLVRCPFRQANSQQFWPQSANAQRNSRPETGGPQNGGEAIDSKLVLEHPHAGALVMPKNDAIAQW